MPSHTPVLLSNTLSLLDPHPGDVVLDCTLGRGGHAAAMAERVGASGRVIGFDLDPANLAAARERVEATGVPFTGVHESFVHAPRRLVEMEVAADVVLADLGFASNQMDDPARGFSARAEGPLDMRLDPTSGGATAADLVAELPESELAAIIHEHGEEPLARKIARKLVETRASEPIQTTTQLARLVVAAYGARARSSRLHPATRTFMALRIAVNGELEALAALLDAVGRGATGGGWIGPGARVAIISFHSLEDRRVKHAFADLAAQGRAERLTRRPVMAGPAEIAVNPRARSARLRAIRLGPSDGASTAPGAAASS